MACDQNQPAVEGEQLQLAIGIGPGLRIKNHVDAHAVGRIKERLDPVGPVVERDFRTKLVADLSLLGRSRRRKHPSLAQLSCDLDRCHPDAARSTLDQYALAMVEPSQQNDVVPTREEHFGKRCRARETVTFWHRHALRCRRTAVLGITTARHQRADRIARTRPCHVRRNALDHAGDIETGYLGCAWWRWIQPPALLDVGTIDACGHNPDEHLAALQFGPRLRLQGQDFRTTRLDDPHRQHRRVTQDKTCELLGSTCRLLARSRTCGPSRHVASMASALADSSARLNAGTAMAASALPVVCATQGIRFWAAKPPRLPIVLIAAIAAAA